MPALDRGIIIGRRTCAPLVLLAAALKASPAAAALLPSPGDKSGLWAAVDPRTLATTSILLSLAAAALLLAFGLISARRSAARLLAGQQSQFIALQADIDRAEGLLEAQGQLSIVYGPGGISLHGSLAGIENLPREASAIANFRAWIEPATAAALEQALARLRAGGEGFATMIRTSDGERLEALGRTAGGLPVLILRAISADRLEQMRLHERLAALESEAAGLRDLLDSVPAPKAKPTKIKPKLDLSDLMPLERDFAFVVDRATRAGDLLKAVLGADRALIADANVFDIYEGAGVPEGKKSVAVSVRLEPREKTLTDAEIEAVAAKIVAEATKKTGATLRG